MELTEQSPEFEQRLEGFLPVLVALAKRLEIGFSREGGAAAFFQKIVALAPETAGAIPALQAIGFTGFDGANARKYLRSLERVYNGFRTVCAGWNASGAKEQIDLAALYTKAGAEDALRILKIDERLATIEQALAGQIPEYQQFCKGAFPRLHAFLAKQDIHVKRPWGPTRGLTFMISYLPLEARATPASLVAQLLEFDGHNATQSKPDPSNRIRVVLEAMAVAWNQVSEQERKLPTKILSAADLDLLIAALQIPEEKVDPRLVAVAAFASETGAFWILRSLAVDVHIRFKADFGVRELLLAMADAYLVPHVKVDILSIPWKHTDGGTASVRSATNHTNTALQRVFDGLNLILGAWKSKPLAEQAFLRPASGERELRLREKLPLLLAAFDPTTLPPTRIAVRAPRPERIVARRQASSNPKPPKPRAPKPKPTAIPAPIPTPVPDAVPESVATPMVSEPDAVPESAVTPMVPEPDAMPESAVTPMALDPDAPPAPVLEQPPNPVLALAPPVRYLALPYYAAEPTAPTETEQRYLQAIAGRHGPSAAAQALIALTANYIRFEDTLPEGVCRELLNIFTTTPHPHLKEQILQELVLFAPESPSTEQAFLSALNPRTPALATAALALIAVDRYHTDRVQAQVAVLASSPIKEGEFFVYRAKALKRGWEM